MQSQVFVNRIATAVPDNECHTRFTEVVPNLILDSRKRNMFCRLVEKSTIESRFTFLQPSEEPGRMEAQDFYRYDRFPTTVERMQFYEKHAFRLAKTALSKLELDEQKDEITHLVVASCTGFYAPGLDIEIMKKFGLNSDVERTFIGFMGCFAGINALKSAYHIVRSNPHAKVLTVNLELCTIHFQKTQNLEQLLSFVIFGDGCAATLVSAEETGLQLLDFYCDVSPGTNDLITWRIGDQGFDMHLSVAVPKVIEKGLPNLRHRLLPNDSPIAHWAIHPGGKAVLDAVQRALHIPKNGLHHAREILRKYGNMSSATVLFVLHRMLEPDVPEGLGLAMAFGPGLTVESMRFAKGPVI